MAGSNLYKELYGARSQMQVLKQELSDLNKKTTSKHSSPIQNKINEVIEKLQHLKVRLFILEKLSSKMYLY